MNTQPDAELEEILETYARKIWDPRQKEFNYYIRENKAPKFKQRLLAWRDRVVREAKRNTLHSLNKKIIGFKTKDQVHEVIIGLLAQLQANQEGRNDG